MSRTGMIRMLLENPVAAFSVFTPLTRSVTNTAMTFETIQLQLDSHVARIVLCRPPLNVINIPMMEEMDRAWTAIEESPASLVVLSGDGEKAFSAGVDIADHAPARVREMLERFHHVIRRIYDSDCISIAAIHGQTLGGAAELTMACDFVIAADNLHLACPEIDVGCYPPVAATLLPELVGKHRASQFVLLGAAASAEEARAMGLVNLVAPAGELDVAVDEWLDRLLQKSAAVLGIAKKALREGAGGDFDLRLKRIEDLYLQKLAGTADMAEGIEAFMEKRPPDWKHR